MFSNGTSQTTRRRKRTIPHRRRRPSTTSKTSPPRMTRTKTMRPTLQRSNPTQTRAKSLTRHKSPRNRPSPTARRTRRPQASRPNLLNLPSPPSPRKHRRKHLRRRTPARSHCSRLSGAHTARMTNFPPRAETQSTASTARPAASMCRTLTT